MVCSSTADTEFHCFVAFVKALFAEGNIDAKELEILNHFDVLDEHKRNKNDKSYQKSWEGNGRVFTGIKELHFKHDEQQKFFATILEIVNTGESNNIIDSN